ncbi:SEN1 N terminal-domain-containing protein [Phakopsora pachyrhizi]|nr:SEN1 N terminal-domain-containing protein [Phakopsora pachyrhizi]
MEGTTLTTTTDLEKFKKFRSLLGELTQKPTDANLWNGATSSGLDWVTNRLQSDLAPLETCSGYGHLLCVKSFSAGRLDPKCQPSTHLLIGDEDMSEIQAFLLRLISFKPKGLVLIWRDALEACLHNCIDCALGLQACTARLAEKWLKLKFGDANSAVTIFLGAIHKCIVNMCQASLERALSSGEHLKTSQVPHGLLTLILSSPELLMEESIWKFTSRIMISQTASNGLKFLPTIHTLPGLILLTMNDETNCSSFSKSQLEHLATVDIQNDKLEGSLTESLQAATTEVVGILNRKHISSELSSSGSKIMAVLASHPTRVHAWQMLQSIISAIPSAALLKLSDNSETSFPLTIMAHADDGGEHHQSIIQCFKMLLRRLGKSFWALKTQHDVTTAAEPEFQDQSSPVCVLKRILGMENFFDNFKSSDATAQFQNWIFPFIISLGDSTDLLAGVLEQLRITLACRLQSPNLAVENRVLAAQAVMNILDNLIYDSSFTGLKEPVIPSSSFTVSSTLPSKLSPQAEQFINCFLAFITELAYSSTLPSPSKWTQVRTQAQTMLEHLAFQESEGLAKALYDLSLLRLKVESNKSLCKPSDFSKLNLRYTKTLWNHLYKISNNFSTSNPFLVKACSLLTRSLSPTSHIDHLTPKPWRLAVSIDDSSVQSMNSLIEGLNEAMTTIRAPLVDTILDLADSNWGSTLIDNLLGGASVMQSLVVLIFSPNDGIHSSSLALIRQWSDSTSRLDCFQTVLSKSPKASFEGILVSLKNAELYCKILPDAMGLARRFVRCMTDVLDVLCSPPSGLLRDRTFVQCLESSVVEQFWSLTCSAVSKIFQRTPHWSQFYQTPVMIDWMRDALIFAEKLVEQFQTFEMVAKERKNLEKLQQSADPPDTQCEMVDSFTMLTESILSWLRLTEPDLLDGSTRVLVKMLEKLAKFKRPLSTMVVEKLESYLRSDRKANLENIKQKFGVILTDQQCAYIKNALASHPDLADRFGSVEIELEEVEFSLDNSSNVISPDVEEPALAISSKKNWSDIFPALKSNDHSSVAEKSATSSSNQAPPKTSSSKLRLDLTHQQSKSNSNSRQPIRKSKAGPSSGGILDSMRRDFRASRPVSSHKARVLSKPAQRPPNSSVPPISTSSSSASKVPSALNTSSSASSSTNGPYYGALNPSDDDSEGEQAPISGLAALAGAQKSMNFTSRRAPEAARKIKVYNDPALEQQQKLMKARKEREQQLKLEKLRMTPDFTMLHRHILQWDYNHTGQTPPNMGHFEHLPPAFKDFEHYLVCLEPLLMSECWQQISKAKEAVTGGEKTFVPCEIVGRTTVDSFIEIYVSIKHGQLPDRQFFGESDLALLETTDHGVVRQTMAKVISLQRKAECFELNLKLNLGCDRQGFSNLLIPKTKWQVTHLCSLSTTQREWAALRSLPYLTLADDILDAKLTPPVAASAEQLSKVMKYQQVNEPQGRAIISSLATPGFSLIQGPPGTGKTSTIVGLVGAFIASRPAVNKPSGGAASITKKILLCAPSNAAVDEVAKRLKEGVRGSQGELIIPKLVRIGADSKVNISVKDIFIDVLVENMGRDMEPQKDSETLLDTTGLIQDLRQQIQELRLTRNSKQDQFGSLSSGSPQFLELNEELTQIKRKIHQLSQKLDEARDQQSASKRSLDAATRKLRMQILQDADVVCSTLSGSGHDYMSQLPFDFETVVVDEACQCVEPALLIPLRYNASQCIMVGDPLQLPPTVLSQAASKAGYDQSLFVRMYNKFRSAAHLLSIQYRMHPSISAFPSKAFYNSKLLDGPDMEKKTAQPWHISGSPFPPYAFFQVVGGREERGKYHSIMNRVEASMAVEIYLRLTREFPKIDFSYRVGIITGYSAQVTEIRRQFRLKFSQEVCSALDINTVDGFQGQEKDIIILSCVRASNNGLVSEGGIGFLKDTRRMNVALTRAKSSLLIIGDKVALRKDSCWASLLDDASQRGALIEVCLFFVIVNKTKKKC